jgi:hypothetical protein
MSELGDSIENCDRSEQLELNGSIESTPSNSNHSEGENVSVDLTHPALRAPLRGGDLHPGVGMRVKG